MGERSIGGKGGKGEKLMGDSSGLVIGGSGEIGTRVTAALGGGGLGDCRRTESSAAAWRHTSGVAASIRAACMFAVNAVHFQTRRLCSL